MNKEIKKKIIVSIIAMLVGFSILICRFFLKNVFTDEKISYVVGFAGGLIVVGISLFVKNLFLLTGTNRAKKLADSVQDERLISINNEAGEITFRIITGLESIICIVLFLLELEKEGIMLSILLGISLLVYLVTYFILSKKK